MPPINVYNLGMAISSYNPEDNIAALATPWGQSALAVIRTSGKGSIDLVAKCFTSSVPLTEKSGNTLAVGTLKDPETGEPLDQVVAAVYRAPKSFTGEDGVELFCHGNIPGLGRIFRVLRRHGFRDAEPGEFTLRAFLNGKIDLTRAEAVHEAVTAKSDQAFSFALERLSGGIEKKVSELRETLVSVAGAIEIQLDYPEEEADLGNYSLKEGIEGCLKVLEALSSTYRTGRIYQEGVRAVIAGRPNAGKSSLFNLFLKKDRAIVSDIPGTTRDYLEEGIILSGIPFQFFDTAGLRYSENIVEAEGIRRSEEIIERADLVLYLVDGARGLSPEDSDNLEKLGSKTPCVKIFSKTDLAAFPVPEGFLGLSTLTLEGFDSLQNRLTEIILETGLPERESVLIDSLRQKEALDNAAGSLKAVLFGLSGGAPLDAVSVDLKAALDSLGEITGEITTEEVLSDLFSRFCVGK